MMMSLKVAYLDATSTRSLPLIPEWIKVTEIPGRYKVLIIERSLWSIGCLEEGSEKD